MRERALLAPCGILKKSLSLWLLQRGRSDRACRALNSLVIFQFFIHWSLWFYEWMCRRSVASCMRKFLIINDNELKVTCNNQNFITGIHNWYTVHSWKHPPLISIHCFIPGLCHHSKPSGVWEVSPEQQCSVNSFNLSANVNHPPPATNLWPSMTASGRNPASMSMLASHGLNTG